MMQHSAPQANDPQQWTMMMQQQTPQPMQQPIPQADQHQMLAPVQFQQHVPQTHDEVKTLWVGDLQFWMDENYLLSCFAQIGEVVSAKIIRNKQTGYSEGYGFVEFTSHAAAERVLQTYNSAVMGQTEQIFRLNWASFGMGERRPDGGPEHSIFVGDLASDVTDFLLQETFRSRYPSVKGAKVVMDPGTGRSKGYGFVRFGEESERTRAMSEMNGVYCSSRPMRVSAAMHKKSVGLAQHYNAQVAPNVEPYQASTTGPPASQGFQYDNDPNNTTIFVGGLDPSVTKEDLRQVFGQFGELVYVKIPAGKGCGFVQFTQRSIAEEALQKIHGTVIGQQAVRLSWGRSPANKLPVGWGQVQPDPNQWNGGYYGHGQVYEGYGYVSPQEAVAYTSGNYPPPPYVNYPSQVN